MRSDMLMRHEFLGGRREARLPGPNMAARSRHPSLQERIDQFKTEMSQAARAPAVRGPIHSSRDPPSRLQRFSLPGTGLEGSPLPQASGPPPVPRAAGPRSRAVGRWRGPSLRAEGVATACLSRRRTRFRDRRRRADREGAARAHRRARGRELDEGSAYPRALGRKYTASCAHRDSRAQAGRGYQSRVGWREGRSGGSAGAGPSTGRD